MNMAQTYTLATPLSVESTNLFSGLTRLLNDLSRWGFVVLPIAAGLAILGLAIFKFFADEQQGMALKQRMKGVGGLFILAFCVNGLIAMLTSYFSG